MKKTFRRHWLVLALVMLLFCHTGVSAMRVGMMFGVHRMENYSSFEFNVRLGLFANFPMGKNFSFQPEIYLARYVNPFAGESYSEGDIRRDVVYSDIMRYLEVPLLFKYRIPLKGDLRPVIMAGGYVAFRLSERRPELTADQMEGQWWGQHGGPLYREYPGAEGGIVVGLGVEHGRGKTRMHFDVRINIGLTNLINVNSDSIVVDGFLVASGYSYSQRNHSMLFNVGISF